MENENFLNDDFLQDLVRKSSVESPADGFVENVMSRIQSQPETIPMKRGLFFFLKSYSGYILLVAFLVGFFWTSDIPVLSWLPGKQYFLNTVLPSFSFLFSWSKSLLGDGKSISIPLMIIIASGLFFLIDRLLNYIKITRRYHSV